VKGGTGRGEENGGEEGDREGLPPLDWRSGYAPGWFVRYKSEFQEII